MFHESKIPARLRPTQECIRAGSNQCLLVTLTRRSSLRKKQSLARQCHDGRDSHRRCRCRSNHPRRATGSRGCGQSGRGARSGSGPRRPSPRCVNPKIPAAECNIGATPINWADPPLGDGPFLIESARPEHRNLRVVVMARLRQPWSIAFLPEGRYPRHRARWRRRRQQAADPGTIANHSKGRSRSEPGGRHAPGSCRRPSGHDGRRPASTLC